MILTPTQTGELILFSSAYQPFSCCTIIEHDTYSSYWNKQDEATCSQGTQTLTHQGCFHSLGTPAGMFCRTLILKQWPGDERPVAQELIPWATQISSLTILINPCWQTRFESIEIICNKKLIVYLVSSGKFWVALNLYGKDSIDFWNQNSYHLKAILPWVVITYGVLFSLLSNVWSEGM